jgi:hypothetical protein
MRFVCGQQVCLVASTWLLKSDHEISIAITRTGATVDFARTANLISDFTRTLTMSSQDTSVVNRGWSSSAWWTVTPMSWHSLDCDHCNRSLPLWGLWPSHLWSSHLKKQSPIGPTLPPVSLCSAFTCEYFPLSAQHLIWGQLPNSWVGTWVQFLLCQNSIHQVLDSCCPIDLVQDHFRLLAAVTYCCTLPGLP